MDVIKYYNTTHKVHPKQFFHKKLIFFKIKDTRILLVPMKHYSMKTDIIKDNTIDR